MEEVAHKTVDGCIFGAFMFEVEMLADCDNGVVHFAENILPFRSEIIYEFLIGLENVLRSG